MVLVAISCSTAACLSRKCWHPRTINQLIKLPEDWIYDKKIKRYFCGQACRERFLYSCSMSQYEPKVQRRINSNFNKVNQKMLESRVK